MFTKWYMVIVAVIWVVAIRLCFMASWGPQQDERAGATVELLLLSALWLPVIGIASAVGIAYGIYRLVALGAAPSHITPAMVPPPRPPCPAFVTHNGRPTVAVDKEVFDQMVKDNEEMKRILGS